MNGLLLVDKPGGMTSHDVVARVRRITGEKSVGHLGTLDPMATGLLPLLLGKWTRLAKFYGSLAKTYTGVIRFGYATDTYDAEGVKTGGSTGAGTIPTLSTELLQSMAAGFMGESEQMPPAYSAKKIGGKAAYALARAGQTPELRPARICISAFRVEAPHDGPDGTLDMAFFLSISSGGYVRSIAHAMGQQAGCGAHLAALRRVAAGPLRINDARTLQQLEAEGYEAALPHPRAVLPELPSVTADAATLARLKHGMAVTLPEFSQAPVVKVFAGQAELAAIATRVAGVLFQPTIVLL